MGTLDGWMTLWRRVTLCAVAASIGTTLAAAGCKPQAPRAASTAPAATTGRTAPTQVDAPPEKAPPETPARQTPKPSATTFNEHVIPLAGRLVTPQRRDAAALPSGMIAPGDLNNDRMSDWVVLVDVIDSQGGTKRQIQAISGADHTTLWAIDAPVTWDRPDADGATAQSLVPEGLRSLQDINDDQVPDIFLFGAGERPGFGAISGKDGIVIGLNATPKNQLIQLVDVRIVTGDSHPDFVFATTLDDADGDENRGHMGFAVYNSTRFIRAVSYKKPFGRLSEGQTLLMGPIPDCNNDKISEILCYGVIPSSRMRTQAEPQFAIVDGQRLRRWVLTRTHEDPTRGPSFMTTPGVVVKDSFPDLIISTPADEGAAKPSQFGLYVMKKLNYEWLLQGDKPGADGARTDVQFGGPVVLTVDLDEDGIPDVATTIVDAAKPTTRKVVAISSSKGVVLKDVVAPVAESRFESRRDRIQLATVPSDANATSTRIGVSGYVTNAGDDAPAILLIDLIGTPKDD
ncbi:MAG TPA: hypothetical protein P5081_01835 [Phycisphaerae bacterium]|nr:hypothetical protein [Phycisphaerae bacterium]HRW51595.1 hypothetical protein [Phycisphaerae bacterium]